MNRSRGLVVGLLAVASMILPAVANADQSFGDVESDGAGAPDVTTVDVANDNDGYVTFRISFGAAQNLPADGTLVLAIDTDRSATSGGRDGEEVDVVVAGAEGGYDYGRWNGSKIDFEIQSDTARVGFRTGAVEILLHKSDLNSAASFDFWIFTNKWVGDAAAGEDAAPDGIGVWTYSFVTKAVSLRAAQPTSRGYAMPGKTLLVQMSAFRTETSAVVTDGAAKCTARIGQQRLKARARFVGTVARCDIVVPKGTSKKTVRGTMEISVPGGRVARPFAFRVV